MLSCKDVTHLISQSQDRRLTRSERVRLRLHLAVCAGCRNFSSQLEFIRKACQRLARGEAPLEGRDD